MNVSRREFLKAGAGAAAAWWAAGCAGVATRTGDSRRQERNAGRLVMDESSIVGRAGHFRVGRSRSGRWWLLTPAGEPFLYRGVCALWMPDNGKGAEALRFRQHWERANGKDPEALVTHCFGLLRDRGFNALGEWSTAQFWNRGWPFTVLIHVRQVRRESNISGKLPDVFDPAWRTAYAACCRETCAPLAGSRDLVGYFVDNEGHWGTARRDYVWGQDNGPMVDRNVLGMEPLLLQTFLASDPKHPGHQAAWDWVLARHGGDVAAVARGWGADFASPAQLREQTARSLVLASRGYRADHEAFAAHYVHEYFRVTAEAIRAHDPNHLLLGPRFGGTPGDEVLKAIDRRHVDVLSWNCYNTGFRKRCAEMHAATRLPQLNGEFSWASGGFLDWQKLRARGTFTEEEKQRCARRGQFVLEEAFTHPALVGYTWYKFCWNPVAADQPGYGLIDSEGRESTFNTPIFGAVNARLEAIARDEVKPVALET